MSASCRVRRVRGSGADHPERAVISAHELVISGASRHFPSFLRDMSRCSLRNCTAFPSLPHTSIISQVPLARPSSSSSPASRSSFPASRSSSLDSLVASSLSKPSRRQPTPSRRQRPQPSALSSSSAPSRPSRRRPTPSLSPIVSALSVPASSQSPTARRRRSPLPMLFPNARQFVDDMAQVGDDSEGSDDSFSDGEVEKWEEENLNGMRVL